MARLSTNVCSLLTYKAITNLRERKIFTFVDFLREDPEKLVKICQLSYPEIMVIRRNVISHFSAFPKSGLDAYHQLLANSALIPTGVPCLDSILDGGLLTGTLTELYSLPSNGKTQMCFAIASNVALTLKQQVLYVDAKGGFSGKRLKNMLDNTCSTLEETEQALKNIVVIPVKSIHQLLSFLYNLRVSLNQDSGDGVWTRLIIIDSLPALFYQFIGEPTNHGLGFMNNLASVLKYIAVENKIACLLTNLANKGLDNDDGSLHFSPVISGASSTYISPLKPALGNYWSHIPNLRLFLHKNPGSNEIEVFITKSSYLKIGKHCKMIINEKGIH